MCAICMCRYLFVPHRLTLFLRAVPVAGGLSVSHLHAACCGACLFLVLPVPPFCLLLCLMCQITTFT